MHNTRPLFSEEQISKKITHLAAEINRDFQNRTVDVVCVLKGSICFAADLIRRLSFPLRIHFMQVRSYGSGTESSGTVHLHFSSEFALAGLEVLLVEDIVDTGITLEFVLEHLREKKPASLKTCVLLDKPSRRKVNVRPDYCGFEIDDWFVVGYGLDYNEFGRNLPYLAVLEENN
jgi:hypoxanthine phosphoribosyltransferase